MLTDSVLFVGWNRPVPGKEIHANELFQSFINYLTKQQQQGNVTSFEPVILGSHGGDLNGFCLVRGAREKLFNMAGQDDWLSLITDCTMTMTNFGVVQGWTGEGVTKQMGRWQKLITR